MAVADKITSIKQHVTNAYTAIQGKGGTIPTNKNIENLNAAITSIATQKPEQAKTATPTKTTQEIVPDSGKALSKVTVNPIPSEYIIPSGIQNITSNGTHDVTTKATVNVNVEFATQEKTVTPTKAVQTVTPDSGKNGLSKVTVNAIPSEYILTTDATAAASDILSGKTAYVKGAKITGTIADYDGSFTNLTSNGSNISPQSVEAPAMLMAAANNQNSITEIYSASEMDSVLTDENVGKYYKYMGETTDTYTHGEIYCVES